MTGSRAGRRLDRSHSRDGAPGAPCLLRTVATAAVLLVAVALSSVPGAQAVCCLCENLVGNQDNCGPVQIPDCDLCATACSSQGGTVRKCCPELANCGDGGADACPAVTNVCYESTAGFCDGTCTGPTETPTSTPTATSTSYGDADIESYADRHTDCHADRYPDGNSHQHRHPQWRLLYRV